MIDALAIAMLVILAFGTGYFLAPLFLFMPPFTTPEKAHRILEERRRRRRG